MSHVTLGGRAEIIDTTEKAVLVGYTDEQGDAATVWIPRSVCLDGDGLVTGDRDVCVAQWFVDGKDLPI